MTKLIHPDGYVGLETNPTVVLGWGSARVPVLTKSEREWLIAALISVDKESA